MITVKKREPAIAGPRSCCLHRKAYLWLFELELPALVDPLFAFSDLEAAVFFADSFSLLFDFVVGMALKIYV